MMIRAALARAPGRFLEIEDVTIEAPRPTEVLVRFAASGICHTDLTGKASWPITQSPMVFGHEGAGVVEALGSAVTRLRPGDTVVASFRSCRECDFCRDGRLPYCRLHGQLNFRGSRADGSTSLNLSGTRIHSGFFGQSSFATHALVEAESLIRFDGRMPLHLAAPLGCGVQTGAGTVLNVLRPSPDSVLAVFGGGGVGMAAVLAARALDVRDVIVVDPVASRLDLAMDLGATDARHPIELSTGSPIEATHAFVSTDAPGALAQALRMVRKNGVVATVAAKGLNEALAELTFGGPEGRVTPAVIEVDAVDLIGSGRTVHGVIQGNSNPAEIIPHLAGLYLTGRFPVDRIVTTYPFGEINKAIDDIQRGAAIKAVVLMPEPSEMRDVR
jgi:aryl-alcohol dehydrogenase